MSSTKNEFSDMDKKIMEKMNLLNSDYVNSLDTFVEGFSNDADDKSDEGFSDDEEGFSDDEGVEGMKSKSKSKSKSISSIFNSSELIPRIDIISDLIKKIGGSNEDVIITKKILTALFTTFLAFLIAHNWYANYFTNPVKERLSDNFSSLKENEFTHYLSTYVVQMVTSIDEYIMVKIPQRIREFINTSEYIGRRSVFYVFLSLAMGMVPVLWEQLSIAFEYIRIKINEIVNVFKQYRKNPIEIRNYFRDTVKSAFDKIFLFKGNEVLSSILGISYIMVFISNIVADQTKGIFENVFNIIPSSMTKLAAGNIFYLIYVIFKFAMFYQPTIAFSSFVITIYIFYYSVMKTGISKMYSLYKTNDAHMNNGRVAFKSDVFATFKNGVESFLKVIHGNFHEIVWFFSIRKTFPDMLNLSTKFLKTVFLGPGIFVVLKIVYSVLSKYGIGTEEMNDVAKGVAEINSQIDVNDYVSKKFEKENDPSTAKEKFFTNMFDKIYNPYKTA
jgi:hypothetical protein